jgi:hypothetical protein
MSRIGFFHDMFDLGKGATVAQEYPQAGQPANPEIDRNGAGQ